jgi:hypothetical protein
VKAGDASKNDSDALLRLRGGPETRGLDASTLCKMSRLDCRGRRLPPNDVDGRILLRGAICRDTDGSRPMAIRDGLRVFCCPCIISNGTANDGPATLVATHDITVGGDGKSLVLCTVYDLSHVNAAHYMPLLCSFCFEGINCERRAPDGLGLSPGGSLKRLHHDP